MSNIIFFSFLSDFLNENNCHLTNNFEGKGLKHYGYQIFSTIVRVRKSSSVFV